MKTLKTVIWLFVLVCTTFIFSQCQNQKTKALGIDNDSEKENIQNAFRTFENFMEDENMELFSEVFSQENLIVISTDGERYFGFENFKTAVFTMFGSYDDGKTDIGSPENVVIDLLPPGDIAWFAYEFVWKGALNNQPFSVDKVRFSGIAKKQNKNWVFEKLHASIAVPE